MKAALLRFRIAAYVVGVLLIVLAFIAMPLKYAAGYDTVVSFVAPAHGTLYMVYLVLVLDLARRARWRLPRTALVALAGTVPIYSFIAESKVNAELRPSIPEHTKRDLQVPPGEPGKKFALPEQAHEPAIERNTRTNDGNGAQTKESHLGQLRPSPKSH